MGHPVRRPQSFEELADLAEIGRLVVDYATAIDQRSFDDLDSVFTPDAYIDYTAMGGIAGPFPEVKAWLADVLPKFSGFQHLVANHAVDLDGDTATGRLMCFNPMVMDTGVRRHHTMLLGLWYDDRYVRTPDGWRIAWRVEEKSWDHNVPGGVKPG